MIRTESAKLTRAYFMLFGMSWIIDMMFLMAYCMDNTFRMTGIIVFFALSAIFGKLFIGRLE
jgi:hypothetical protein